jgi:hypothetical protein
MGKDFILDSGASISGVDVANAQSLTVCGARGVQGVGGPAQQLPLVHGGEIRLVVTDGDGECHEVDHSPTMAILGHNLLGADVFRALGLKLTWDYNEQPAAVTLSI